LLERRSVGLSGAAEIPDGRTGDVVEAIEAGGTTITELPEEAWLLLPPPPPPPPELAAFVIAVDVELWDETLFAASYATTVYEYAVLAERPLSP